MTDRLNLSFTNDEHDLFLKVQNLPNSSGTIKDLLRQYFAGTLNTPANPEKPELTPEEDALQIERIYKRYFGHLKDYEGVSDYIVCMGGDTKAKAALDSITNNLMDRYGISTYAKVMTLFNDRNPRYRRLLE